MAQYIQGPDFKDPAISDILVTSEPERNWLESVWPRFLSLFRRRKAEGIARSEVVRGLLEKNGTKPTGKYRLLILSIITLGAVAVIAKAELGLPKSIPSISLRSMVPTMGDKKANVSSPDENALQERVAAIETRLRTEFEARLKNLEQKTVLPTPVDPPPALVEKPKPDLVPPPNPQPEASPTPKVEPPAIEKHPAKVPIEKDSVDEPVPKPTTTTVRAAVRTVAAKAEAKLEPTEPTTRRKPEITKSPGSDRPVIRLNPEDLIKAGLIPRPKR